MSIADTLDALPTSRARVARLASTLVAEDVSAWFGEHKVLHRVSLEMEANQVTALIGPSGCGKSTFLRILNRMHELVPSASLAGTVRIDGVDIYRSDLLVTEIRRKIGMVFQKPNPFPAMTVAENVVAGLKLSGQRVSRSDAPHLVEECLTRRALERGQEPARHRGRRALRRSAATPVHRARSPCNRRSCSWTNRAPRSTRRRRGASRRRSTSCAKR